MSISSTEETKMKNHGFMASDFFTFETDEENVMVILTIKDEESEKKDVHTYLENQPDIPRGAKQIPQQNNQDFILRSHLLIA